MVNKFYKRKPLIGMRKLTKSEFKALWSKWRSLDAAGRINEINNYKWGHHLAWCVNEMRELADPLLIKSLTIKLEIKHSQLEAA